MKVKELKKLLRHLDDESDVRLLDAESGHFNDVVRVEDRRDDMNRRFVAILDFEASK